MKESELTFQKKTENVQLELNAFIKSNISPSLFISDEHKLSDNEFLYSINNSYPKMIWDRHEKIAIYRFINIYNIGVLKAKDTGHNIKILEITDKREMHERFNCEIQNIYKKAEIALLKTIHDHLVRIPFVQTAMSPIRIILEKVNMEGEVPASEKFGYRNPEKIQKYVNFLVSLNFLKVSEGKLVPAGELNAIRSMEISLQEFHNKILAAVLRRGFSYIQDYLHLTLITPYIRLANSYFFPSYESGKLLEFSIEDFQKSYYDIYDIRKSPDKIMSQLSYVAEQNIITEVKAGYYKGEEHIFNNFKNLAPAI